MRTRCVKDLKFYFCSAPSLNEKYILDDNERRHSSKPHPEKCDIKYLPVRLDYIQTTFFGSINRQRFRLGIYGDKTVCNQIILEEIDLKYLC